MYVCGCEVVVGGGEVGVVWRCEGMLNAMYRFRHRQRPLGHGPVRLAFMERWLQ